MTVCSATGVGWAGALAAVDVDAIGVPEEMGWEPFEAAEGAVDVIFTGADCPAPSCCGGLMRVLMDGRFCPVEEEVPVVFGDWESETGDCR